MLDLDAGRGREALVRLLQRARHRTSDPELFAALCQVCRYSGLLDGSLRAHERALQLDSKIRTSSGVHTLFIRGEYPRVIEFVLQEWRSHAYIGLASLAALGRFDEAIEAARAKQSELSASSRLRSMVVSLTALLEGDRAQSVRSCAEATADAPDPELVFYASRHLAFIGDAAAAIDYLSRVVDAGYYCAPSLEQDPWFEPIREHAAFGELLRKARAGRRLVLEAYRAVGGPEILGTADFD
jgi:tetratricopeptide (TPR) repeat protein